MKRFSVVTVWFLVAMALYVASIGPAFRLAAMRYGNGNAWLASSGPYKGEPVLNTCWHFYKPVTIPARHGGLYYEWLEWYVNDVWAVPDHTSYYIEFWPH